MDLLAVPYPMTVIANVGATIPDNVLNERLGRVASLSGATPSLSFDLGSAKAVDTLGLLATNLDADDTVTWVASASSGFTSPLHNVVYSPALASPTIGINRVHRQHMVKLAAPVTARYWRATIGASSAVRTIGRAIIAKAFEPAEPRDYGWDMRVVDLGAVDVTDLGIEDVKTRAKVMAYNWIWSGLTDAEAQDLAMEVMLYAGVTRDVLLCLDPTSPRLHNLIGYGKLTEPATATNYAEGWTELKCSLRSRLILSL